MRLILIFLFTSIVSNWLSESARAGEADILIIESYDSTYAWDKGYLEVIKSTLGPKYKYTNFEMDTKRKPKEEHQAMADQAWQKYQTLKPALVFLGDDAALKFLGRKFAAETTPVVFLGVNGSPLNYFDGGTLPPNFSGMLERPLLKRSIVHLKEILPATKKVLVLFDSDLTSQISKELIFEGADQIRLPAGPKDEILVEVKLLKDFEGWKKTVASAKGGYDVVIIGLYQTLVDPKGHNVNPEEVINWTSENIGVPSFAFWDFAVGKSKSIGGLVLNGKLHGKEAADLALKRLNGEFKAGGKTVFVGEQGSFLFSKTQLKKWKITLPLDIEKATDFVE